MLVARFDLTTLISLRQWLGLTSYMYPLNSYKHFNIFNEIQKCIWYICMNFRGKITWQLCFVEWNKQTKIMYRYVVWFKIWMQLLVWNWNAIIFTFLLANWCGDISFLCAPIHPLVNNLSAFYITVIHLVGKTTSVM